ncbi:MAG TPA: hypothetical protein DCF44_09815 [Chitinophagaceae bacterium]|nr:hypothetical protein [Chitinophagaceae bacterium]
MSIRFGDTGKVFFGMPIFIARNCIPIVDRRDMKIIVYLLERNILQHVMVLNIFTIISKPNYLPYHIICDSFRSTDLKWNHSRIRLYGNLWHHSSGYFRQNGPVPAGKLK